MRNISWAILLLALGIPVAHAQDEFEKPPIEYSKASPDNAVSRLQERLERGEANLAFDQSHGYLRSVLQALNAPIESQTLVFSKTSMQRGRISPETPRAIYFGDDAYVGYCHAGDVLEISVADPVLGAVFYTLDQKQASTPTLVRQSDRCLLCHVSHHSTEAPSHLLRSVFTDPAGFPILSEGSYRVDHTTPLENRWGGWYVTGTHGDQNHLGNLLVRDTPVTRPVSNPEGRNITDVSDRFPAGNYLTHHSDLVALMVLEHQTLMHNLITRAHYTTRQALAYEKEMNRALGHPADHRLDSTGRRIANAGDELVEGLLFAGEAPLTSAMAGTSEFSTVFMKTGPRDRHGRSLREFDLTKRIFKYPCSYVIYSAAFDELPPEMKAYVADRLQAVLTQDSDSPAEHKKQDQNKAFAHLSADDRKAVGEILSETKPELLGRVDDVKE